MMSSVVGLNGFGRIARIILRTCFMRSNIEIIAINDPEIDIEYICYLIRFDSTHGKLNREISYSDDEIIINGKKIKVFHEKSPSSIPWHTLGVEYVVEASGMFSNMDKASGHLKSTSVKCVLVTSPSVDIPMLILGVNEHAIGKDERVISCASSTLYCLATIAKVLEDNFGISEGFVTSIHAMTPSLKPLDGLCLNGRHWRDHRSIHQNIIPGATDACKALGKIIPSLNDKFCGLAFRVPTVNVSVLDITVRLNKSTNIQEICAQIGKESKDRMKNIINTSYDEVVSSDFMNDEHSCILDVNSCLELKPTSFKLICWYENEYSYACRVIDTIFLLQARCKNEKCTKSGLKSRTESTCDDIRNCNAGNHASNEIFNPFILGFDFNNVDEYIPIVPLTYVDEQSGHDAEVNVGEEIIIQNIVYNHKSNMNIAQIDEPNIMKKRERLEIVKMEPAKIASKTEDLLQEADHVEEKEANTVFNSSRSVNKLSYPNDEKLKSFIYRNNDKSSIVKIGNVSYIDSIVNILSQTKTENVKEATIDIERGTDTKYENVIEDILVEESIMDVKPKHQTNPTHIEASIIISDKNSKEHTVVSITGKSNKNTHGINKNINRASRSHEYFKHDKISQRSTTEQNDVVLSLEFRNKRHNARNTKNNKTNNRAEDNNSKILPMSSYSLDPKKLIIDEEPQTSEYIENNKSEMIRKNILSSVLHTSNGDVPALDYFKLINKRERITNDNLLDKLTSETDSDLSFRMDETKSQIIDISDFSSSTDDFARLDKICKIIEISDELSDKLFSALKIDSRSGKKKW